MSDTPIPELEGQPPPRTLVRASAGTGKTHTLTGRMLGALLAPGGMDDPARVLATTFTRKAAGEILNRVLERLLDAAHDGSKRDRLEAQTGVPLPPVAYERAAVELARRMDRLRIMTIDALLFRMARGAGLDLAMAPGWRLADERDERVMRRAALEAALAAGESGGPAGSLTPDAVITLIRLTGKRPLSARVLASLEGLVDSAHPAYLETTRGSVGGDAGAFAGLWTRVGPRGEPLDGDGLAAALSAVRDAPVPDSGSGKNTRPDRRFVDAVARVIACARTQDWEAVATHTLVRAAITGGTFYRKAVDGDLGAALRVLGEHAACHVLGQLRERNGAAGRLLARYESCLWDARRASGAVGFGEITRLLVWSDVLDRLGELWYRLDAGLSTLLIDEAQDTSLLQFRMLEPLLDELLSTEEAGRGVLVVGDPKQSLYAWRQAEAELMDAMGVKWGSLEQRTLSASWRSGRVVLGAVNAVFASLGSCACLTRDDRPGLGDAARAFVEGYDEHRPGERATDAGPRGDELGLVQVWTLPAQGDADTHDSHDSNDSNDTHGSEGTHDAHGSHDSHASNGSHASRTNSADARPKPDMARGVAEAVGRLLTEAGGTRVEVGVLVRTNKPIRALVRALRQAGIDASEEGGAPLSDDPLVSSVLSLLHLADHPGDTLCAYHVAMTPVGRAIGWHGVPSRARIRRRAMRLRRALASRGWAAVLETLVERIAAIDGVPGASVTRLWQMLGLVREFEATAPVRTGPLVEMIAERRVASGGQAQVRVMTIHAAKGLEFDAVVLPELDRTWGGRAGALLARDGPLGGATAASLSVSRDVAGLHPMLGQMVRQRDRREAFEGLCTLYVAMTRARRALVMLVGEYDDAKAKPTSAASAARVVRSGLRAGGGDPPLDAAGAGELVYERRVGEWWVRPGAAGAAARTPEGGPIEIRLGEADRGSLRRARVVPPSSLEGRGPGGAIALGARFAMGAPTGGAPTGPSARDLGTIVHAMLASIEWLDDDAASGWDALEPMLREAGRIEHARRYVAGDAEAVVDAGLAMLREAMGGAGSRVRECLTRGWSMDANGDHGSHGSHIPSGPMTPEARREWAFLCQDEPGDDPGQGPRLLSGAIDRLVLVRAGGVAPGTLGAVVRGDVIDFKTDRIASPDELAERVAHYAPQVRAYQRAVARMFALPPERVRGVLAFVAAGEVVEVTQ
ncbi:MAG: UvrD-helicase domain-containing protein [Phycisphaeraceae bacterium]|nr:UvrD-helicase domain-containing protein [Phycisphaeraceae bacterium]